MTKAKAKLKKVRNPDLWLPFIRRCQAEVMRHGVVGQCKNEAKWPENVLKGGTPVWCTQHSRAVRELAKKEIYGG